MTTPTLALVRGFLLIAASAAALAGPACSRPGAQAGALRDSDLAAIRQLRTAFVEYELRGDRRAQAELYAPDAVLLEPNAPLFRGRQAIRGGLEEFDVRLRAFTLQSLAVDGGGSLAYDRGVYALEYLDPAREAKASERGNYLMVLRRQEDGAWRIAALIHNSSEPLPQRARPVGR
jgi:uncharacterized protein (TIGR02246 family)